MSSKSREKIYKIIEERSKEGKFTKIKDLDEHEDIGIGDRQIREHIKKLNQGRISTNEERNAHRYYTEHLNPENMEQKPTPLEEKVEERAVRVLTEKLKENTQESTLSYQNAISNWQNSEDHDKSSNELKEKWEKGYLEDRTIRKITVNIPNPNKEKVENEVYVKNVILEKISEIVEKADEKYQEWLNRKEKEALEEREEMRSKNTKEATVEDLSVTLETHVSCAIFAFYRCPDNNVRQGLENIEKGKYDDLLKKGVAQERELKIDSEIFEEKFTKAKTSVLEELRENIEDGEIHRPLRRPIIREVDERENLVGTYLRWSMEEKLREEGEEILDQWEESNVDWNELREKTENKVENQWKIKPKEEVFQENFNSAKEDVLEFTLEKFP